MRQRTLRGASMGHALARTHTHTHTHTHTEITFAAFLFPSLGSLTFFSVVSFQRRLHIYVEASKVALPFPLLWTAHPPMHWKLPHFTPLGCLTPLGCQDPWARLPSNCDCFYPALCPPILVRGRNTPRVGTPQTLTLDPHHIPSSHVSESAHSESHLTPEP